jgi:uncharacterized protein (DUF1330 family)
MTVYAIAMFSITDRAAYEKYQAQFMSVMNGHKGRLLAADEHPVVLEGNWDRDKVVVLSLSGLSRVSRIPRNIRKFRRIGEPARTDLLC